MSSHVRRTAVRVLVGLSAALALMFLATARSPAQAVSTPEDFYLVGIEATHQVFGMLKIFGAVQSGDSFEVLASQPSPTTLSLSFSAVQAEAVSAPTNPIQLLLSDDSGGRYSFSVGGIGVTGSGRAIVELLDGVDGVDRWLHVEQALAVLGRGGKAQSLAALEGGRMKGIDFARGRPVSVFTDITDDRKLGKDLGDILALNARSGIEAMSRRYSVDMTGVIRITAELLNVRRGQGVLNIM